MTPQIADFLHMEPAQQTIATTSTPDHRAKKRRRWLVRDVDGRDTSSRRFRTIYRTLINDLDYEPSELDRALVKQAATLLLRIETLQTAVLQGQPVDDEMLIRLSSTLQRLLNKLRANPKKSQKPTGRTLAEHLANRAARATNAASGGEAA